MSKTLVSSSLIAGIACAALATPSACGQQLPTGKPDHPSSLVVRPLSTRSSRSRADALLRQMTPEEKIGQMGVVAVFGHSTALEEQIKAGRMGSVLFASDAATTNHLQHLAVENSRLHIPLLCGFDVIHGLRTIFPVPIAMAATWDPAVVENAFADAAAESRAVGIDWVYSPMVDIARDPRWGRMVEGAGEDPFLGAAMARASVQGFQRSEASGVIATVKHFAGYGAAEGGRDYEAVNLSDDQLQNVYLPPFKAAIDAGAGSVMSAYMDLNGVPATGNRWLLQDVLRKQLGFTGFVVSDMFAVHDLRTHGFAVDVDDAALKAFTAGVNIEMALGKTDYSVGLPKALQEGRITNQQLDDMVRPVLEAKIRLGLFEHPYVDERTVPQKLLTATTRGHAREVAERSAVLLRNENAILPLDMSRYKKIAVIGPLADSQADTLGSWAFAAQPNEAVTPLQGLRTALGNNASIEFSQGVQIIRRYASPMAALVKGAKQTQWSSEKSDDELKKAVALAGTSDVTLLFLGENQDMSGEAASRSSLELPGRQEELLEAVVAAGKPVILVLLNGRPLDLRWANSHVPAILEAWYPGTEGGNAVANLLLGKATPGGKLPFTWPRDVGQVPMFYAHNLTQAPSMQGRRYWNEESTPLYPFGFGLSYAQFNVHDLTLDTTTTGVNGTIQATALVENTSDHAGDAVVQLYLHQQSGSSSRPVRELKGFDRVSIAPHATQTVRFTITPEQRSYWSSSTHTVVSDSAKFDVWIGLDSEAKLHGEFMIR